MRHFFVSRLLFFFNDTATTEIYTLSLHDALPISPGSRSSISADPSGCSGRARPERSEEHTSELQSLRHLVCRLLLEKKKKHLLPGLCSKNQQTKRHRERARLRA